MIFTCLSEEQLVSFSFDTPLKTCFSFLSSSNQIRNKNKIIFHIMKFINVLKSPILWALLVTYISLSDGLKSSKKRTENGGDISPASMSSDEREQLFDGLDDPESSAQAIRPNTVNPYSTQLLLQNQAGLSGLYNNPGLFGGNTNSAAAAAAIGSGQGLNGNSFVNAALGGLNAYQNPLLYGGGNFPGVASPDIFSQSAAAAQLYNNPYLGAGAFGGAGISQGINPLLLRGATNLQYPIVGGNNPYLNAQALLSPYTNYNQLNPYNNFPFASRFGIGLGRSNVNSRQNSNSNNNNDE